MNVGRDMLERAPAQIKHMIILSDGQTSGNGYAQMAQEMANRGITISTVALGQNSARALMEQLAQTGKWRYYETNDPAKVRRSLRKRRWRHRSPRLKRTCLQPFPWENTPCSTAMKTLIYPLCSAT